MNTPGTVVILFGAILLGMSSAAGATHARDGSSFERAILVEGSYEHSVDWEWNYLKKPLRLRAMPREQASTRHRGRTYDIFVFSDRAVYFDVTRFADRIFKKRSKSLEQLMKEMGIPVEKRE